MIKIEATENFSVCNIYKKLTREIISLCLVNTANEITLIFICFSDERVKYSPSIRDIVFDRSLSSSVFLGYK